MGRFNSLKQRYREFKTEVERVIFSMVANRALFPSSKLKLEEWIPQKAMIPGLQQLDGKAHNKAHCRINTHLVYKEYLKMDLKGNLKTNTQAVKEAEHLDGKYLIRTSDDTLFVEDVAIGFKQLHVVEHAFRTLKTTLELRPVYHRMEERIRAHIVLCWLALLVRLAEVNTRQTGESLRSELDNRYLIECESMDGKVWQRTELTEAQMRILFLLEISEPAKSDISLQKESKT